VAKLIPKFRKDRDYNDDYGSFGNRKKRNTYNPAKKLANYQYDNYFGEYSEDDYQKSSRKRNKNHY